MKILKGWVLMMLLLVTMMTACSSTSSSSGSDTTGGTETGTTTIDTSVLADRMESTASALVPSITGAQAGASIAKVISYEDEDAWDLYLDEDNLYVLTDVFGDPDVDPQVVTKIRVLLEQFKNDVGQLFARDDDFSCTGGSVLADADTVTIAFFGDLANGEADDRRFDCFDQDESETKLYGKEGDNVVRVVTMSDMTSDNEESVESRGDQVSIRSVVVATYAEASETEGEATVTAIYLDLQYAQSTNYNGVDDEFGTDDDVAFKSRSRITGRAELDASETLSAGAGDFTVTKFDDGVNDDESSYELTSKTFGRGSYETDAQVIFNVNSDVVPLNTAAGIYCLQMPSDDSGLPAYAESSNCTDLETAYAWGTSTFPFELVPAIEENFEEKDFFAGNVVDLISDPGVEDGNFTIPQYQSATEETPEEQEAQQEEVQGS